MPDWFVIHNGKTVGPITSAQLRQLAKSKKISRETKLRKDGSNKWATAGKVKGLFEATDISVKSKALAKFEAKPPEKHKPRFTEATPAPIVVNQMPVATKECMFCGELIAAAAIKCRFCNEFLDGRPQAASNPAQPVVVQQPAPAVNVTQVTNVGVTNKRWNALVAMFLSLILPGLGQLYKGQVLNGLAWLALTLIGYVCFVIPGLVLHVCCILGAGLGNPYR